MRIFMGDFYQKRPLSLPLHNLVDRPCGLEGRATHVSKRRPNGLNFTSLIRARRLGLVAIIDKIAKVDSHR